jgi:uncharacterized protein (DUF58 family)
MSRAVSNRFVDPKLLSKISDLQLIAKTVVEGFLAGLHRSPYHGFSLDFAEYREYSPGDDIRSVDWKVYGRSDRFYVKKYEGDTNTQLYLLMDVSKSMGFSSGQLSKLDYARFLAASLAYFAMRQKDAAGVICFDSDVVSQTPPRTRHGHFFTILRQLEDVQVGGQTDISGVLEKLAHLIRRRALVVLMSDFYQEIEKIAKILRFFHHRGNDVILFHILDPVELEMPLSQISTVEDMETGEYLSYAPDYSRQTYLDLLKEHVAALRRECQNVYIDYRLLSTEEPLDRAIHQYLSLREKKY